jgi:hypothetical protein
VLRLDTRHAAIVRPVPAAPSCASMVSQLVVHVFDLFIANFAPEMQRLSSIYVSFAGHF